jgi:ribosomal subunit interface protein
MRIDFKFRHLDPSEELCDYVSEKVHHLDKFEMKPVRMEFTFTQEKATLRVDVHVRGQDIEMHAHSEVDNFFVGVDQVLAKIGRQMSRKKSRVQSHKVS